MHGAHACVCLPVVPGKGRDGQGGGAPKCYTVCQVDHFGAHFGRWFLMTFDDSFKEIKKKRVSKVVKRGGPVRPVRPVYFL